MNRIVVLLNDADLAEVKRRAGLIPLSTWIRSQLIANGSESSEPPSRTVTIAHHPACKCERCKPATKSRQKDRP